MLHPPKLRYEEKRIKSLISYNILDTPSDESFDNLTSIASIICNTPISFINYIDKDRVWSKSKFGVDSSETTRNITFCTHLVNHKEGLFQIIDARKDNRFKNNPFVTGEPNIIFYASFPLQDKEGLTIGNLCVVDFTPRELTKEQAKSLKALTDQAMVLTEHHKTKMHIADLQKKNLELERFAYIAAHDLKAPLHNIHSLSSLLGEMYKNKLNEDGKTIILHINKASDKLRELIDGLLEYSKNPSVLKTSQSYLNINQLQKEFVELFNFNTTFSLTVKSELESIYTNKVALHQILLNLIENAIKYNNKEQTLVNIGITESKNHYHFYVEDNGPGIAHNQQEKIFDIFKIVEAKDKFGQRGNGIGLATVKKLIEELGGEITIVSNEGEGCKFNFSLEKKEPFTI